MRYWVAIPAWAAAMCLLPAWQGHALYAATHYAEGATLPDSTQPRILPKSAAQRFGERIGLQDAHLAVDPAGGGLEWTGEVDPGRFRRGASHAIAVEPLDHLDGTLERRPGGFTRAASEVGPGSLLWRAYDRHPFTRVQEPVIVPLGGRRAVAVAPYVGYRGFPVRHPYWQGVLVLHQDGRLEDLTPAAARARPELVRSGRLFPEALARHLAEAYGYRPGAGRARTQVDDPPGNPQPYLTDLGDRLIDWVTVAHPPGDEDTASAVFLTDAATGATSVWHPRPGERVLSNQGAVALARSLGLRWQRCCDENGDPYDIRVATEPRPVFVRGRFLYLVSIVPVNGLHTPEPVDRTVLIDARRGRILNVFDHADPRAVDQLRAALR
jgi:hypothetical protein